LKCTHDDEHKKPCRYCGEDVCLGCYLSIHSDELCMYSEDDMGVEGNIIKCDDIEEHTKMLRWIAVETYMVGFAFVLVLMGVIAIFGGWT